MLPDAAGERLAERYPVDRERVAGRNPSLVRFFEHGGAEPPQLFVQQADGVLGIVRAQRVRADQLGQAIELVRRRTAYGFLLDELDAHTRIREEERRFGSREPTSDDHHAFHGDRAYTREARAASAPSRQVAFQDAISSGEAPASWRGPGV